MKILENNKWRPAMESMPLISVIVPIYNVEKYIKKCVRSILKQDYKNIEIILVDDGSPDHSANLIEELKKEDSRIITLHKINGGVSSARNAGMDIAKGEYILFVDGDDWVESNYVSYFLNLVSTFNVPIGMDRNFYSINNNISSNKIYLSDSLKVMEWIYLGDVFVAVWNKIYKTSFLRENNIKFDERIWYGEGMLFNIDCLQYVDNVAIGEKCVYHQTPNPDSAMRKFNLNSNFCGIKSLDIQRNHWIKYNKRVENSWEYHRRAFYWQIMSGLAKSGQEKKYRTEYDDCAWNLRHGLWKSLRVNISLREKILYICLAINPYFMANRIRRKFRKR